MGEVVLRLQGWNIMEFVGGGCAAVKVVATGC